MCEISWIDANGVATPDDNAPIGRVRCKCYDWRMGVKQSTFAYSRWFMICEEHAKRLDEPDMVEWQFEPLKNYEITFLWGNGDNTWIYDAATDYHAALALALDKCPEGARVCSIVFMTPQQVDANKASMRGREKQLVAN